MSSAGLGALDLLLFLLVVALALWVRAQSRRINELTRRLSELELEGARRAVSSTPEVQPIRPQPSPAQSTEEAPLLLTTPIAPDELLLDTPLPDVSNDEEPTPLPRPPATITPMRHEPAPEKRDRQLEKWLAENALAWIGGIATAFGAIALVSVAAQQNWFTPPVQLACAVALGALLIGVSEWARRVTRAKPPGHPLVAALLAGAGVVSFYVTSWATLGLYHFIDWPTAAALLCLCALLLIGLAFLHGEALGVLAVVAVLLAPPLTHVVLWPDMALTLYVCATSIAGLTLAWLRRWAWVAVATLVGAYFWFAAALAADDVPRALALLSFSALGGVAIARRSALTDEPGATWSWRRAGLLLPGIAISVSSVLLIWTWLSLAPAPSGSVIGPALIGVLFVALAAASVRSRVAAPAAFVVSVAALVAGFVVYLRARHVFGPIGADFYPLILFSAAWITAAALGTRPHRRARTLVAVTGALGAGVLTLLAATSRTDWHGLDAWAPLFVGAAILFVAAWQTARGVPAPDKDNAVDSWVGAAVVLTLIGIEAAFSPAMRVAAHAGAALVFAYGVRTHGWRGLRFAAAAAATISIAHALSSNLFGATLAGAIPLWQALATLSVSAGLLFGASRLALRNAAATADALSLAALITLLIAVFLALRWFASGGVAAPIDRLTETSLRIVALLSAGHLALPRDASSQTFIGRWRGHAFMAAGLTYALFAPVLLINPWWGAAPATIIGPPLLDTLALAFGAPAALALAASNRLYLRQRGFARLYAASGGVLALTWLALVVRRAFHATNMAGAPVGPFEAACYALLLLGFALAIAFVARRREAQLAARPFTQDLIAATRGSAWAALVVSLWIMLVIRHPWWGGQDAASTDAVSTGLATFAQAVATGAALVLGRVLSRSRAVESTRFAAAAAAILFAWSFGHAAIRWAFHQGAMDDGAITASFEGYAHSLWPLALVLAGAALTARVPGRDTVRAYLYDLQAIWASAIWPALAFAALGLWCLFNPWWGVNAAKTTGDATPGLLALALAAFLSAGATKVLHVRAPTLLARFVTVAVIAHVGIALTMLVRRAYHATQFSSAPAVDLELWTYSAAWALLGGLVFWLGLQRANATLRWTGLSLLFATAAYVFYLAFTRLHDVARAGSMLGLALVLLIVAWAARMYRPKPTGPLDLSDVTAGARRERPRDRR